MPCYKPLRAWYRKPRIGFQPFRGASKIALPCGQCIGCDLDHSAEWATRCAHEAKLHRQNSFLTLTLDDEHLPNKYSTGLLNDRCEKVYAGSLDHRQIQLFLKKLRYYLEAQLCGASAPQSPINASKKRSAGKPIRYYMCGEYGERYRRPHYHMCLFGHDFQDKRFHTTTPAGSHSYTSELLDRIWGNGHAYIGELNWQSAAYAARYCLKKITGEPAKDHYTTICQETGEIVKLTPEYAQMSRATGIGKPWLEKYNTDVYPHGYVVLATGKKIKTPKYYDKQFQKEKPNEYELMKQRRLQALDLQFEEQSTHRLRVKETIARQKLQHRQQKF